MSKRFLIILAVIIVGFGALLVFNKKDEAKKDAGGGNAKATLSEHKSEEGSSGVSLVEYGDFQCPACYSYYPFVKQLKEDFKGVVTFQFRNFPLTEIHQNALVSARAAEAAAMQDKFWEMHDKLYENQKAWESSQSPSALFEGYAGELGLDVEKFKTDSRAEQTNDVIQADRNYAREQGYSSTPTFVLNGKKIEKTPTTYEEFKKLVEDAVKAKQNG